MALSKENYEKINPNGLYKHINRDYQSKYDNRGCGRYHCKNWNFRPRYHDEEIFMLDTYFHSFDSHCIKLSDDNIDDFEFVFDFSEVEQIKDSEADEYEQSELYCVAIGSGGIQYGSHYWKPKGLEKSKINQYKKLLENESTQKLRLEWAQNDVKRFIEANPEVLK